MPARPELYALITWYFLNEFKQSKHSVTSCLHETAYLILPALVFLLLISSLLGNQTS
ncbi:hypothetical protein ASPZODRAFT_136521 [Penicilliopsis zonata CBS 506.65]|uniref:Uncharacterized protein n=1 Tax=Penicilliopsis zonata CBS 506.65 TaxID=1073090 RepID=A0A1L9S822_9EURO|nr:hypothetical protein ASPZODRAFT_136521 [Penicilliopsis zonata CBS 506.65]OJJ43301.1 hypothetical protein ASPZODRAFT_136521 [Penicilliopsis zonata CBS 506.65]